MYLIPLDAQNLHRLRNSPLLGVTFAWLTRTPNTTVVRTQTNAPGALRPFFRLFLDRPPFHAR